MMTDCVYIKGLDCTLKLTENLDEFCDSLCNYYMDWKDQEFEKWYAENESRFHCGQFDEKQIAMSAFFHALTIQKP